MLSTGSRAGYIWANHELTPAILSRTKVVPRSLRSSRSAKQSVQNVSEFVSFLQEFAAGDLYANCDMSTAAPALNVADFSCFLQKFVAGCL